MKNSWAADAAFIIITSKVQGEKSLATIFSHRTWKWGGQYVNQFKLLPAVMCPSGNCKLIDWFPSWWCARPPTPTDNQWSGGAANAQSASGPLIALSVSAGDFSSFYFLHPTAASLLHAESCTFCTWRVKYYKKAQREIGWVNSSGWFA